MNVWIKYLYWSDKYPTGPDDPECTSFMKRGPKSRIPLTEPPFKIIHEG